MLSLAAMVMDEPVRRKPPAIDEGYFARIAEGDASAFAALYREAAPAVFAYALSVLKNRESAEDITQETFLKVRGAAHLYKKQGKPLAFLFTIARNLCLMQLRKARRVIPAEDPETLSAPEIWPAADAEDRLVLEEAFRVLGDTERQVILLHAVTGLKHREIASLLDLPLGTVLTGYHRGIRKLRRELEEKR